MSPALQTDRLHLLPVAADDLDHFAALYGDAEVMRFIHTRGALTREQAGERLNFMIDHWRRHGYGMWALFRKTDGAFVGRCGLRRMDGSDEVELGYTLLKPFWGHGFATEAARAVVSYVFDVLRWQRLVAIADPHNVASINVMKKLGMTFEHMGRYYETKCALYSLAPPTPRPPPSG